MHVNLTEAAEIFGVTTNTIKAWIRKGAPVLQSGGQGRPWVLDTALFRVWREDQVKLEAMGDLHSMDFDEARRQKMAAEAALAHIELAQKRRELVPISEVDKIVGDEYSNVRARILGMKPRLTAQLGLDEQHRNLLDNTITECLAELSADSAQYTEPDETEDAEAAA